jgi:hypothetical protein
MTQRASARRGPNGRYFPSIGGELLIPAIAKDGFYRKDTAKALAQKWLRANFRPEVHVPFEFPSPPGVQSPPVARPVPTGFIDNPRTKLGPQPNSTYHMSEPIRNTLEYEPPSVFNSDFKWFATAEGDDHEHPAVVSPITPPAPIKPRFAIVMSPYEEGMRGRKNPYPSGTEAHDEWMAGFYSR